MRCRVPRFDCRIRLTDQTNAQNLTQIANICILKNAGDGYGKIDKAKANEVLVLSYSVCGEIFGKLAGLI